MAKKLQTIFKLNQSKNSDNKKSKHLEIQEIKKEWYKIKGNRNPEEKELYHQFKKLLDRYYGKQKKIKKNKI